MADTPTITKIDDDTFQVTTQDTQTYKISDLQNQISDEQAIIDGQTAIKTDCDARIASAQAKIDQLTDLITQASALK